MRVKNLTQYDTRYLRKLFLACEKQLRYVYMSYADKSIFAFHENRDVEVKYGRRFTVSGYAWFNSGSIVMKLPRENALARSVAQVYLHEIGHNLGLRHKQQIPSQKINVDFWPDEKVSVKEIVKKPKPNIVQVRAAKAQKKLDDWQRKLKRAKGFVKKYQRKVRYYEKKTAANK